MGGMEFRVERGAKTKGDAWKYGDLVLYWKTPSGWQKVPLDFVFLCADFFSENEEILFPSRLDYEGGRKPIREIGVAARAGYQAARSKLFDERAAAHARDEEGWELT